MSYPKEFTEFYKLMEILHLKMDFLIKNLLFQQGKLNTEAFDEEYAALMSEYEALKEKIKVLAHEGNDEKTTKQHFETTANSSKPDDSATATVKTDLTPGPVGILEFLKSRQIDVVGYSGIPVERNEFDKLAVFMGKKYDNIKILLKAIKSSINTGKTISLFLTNQTQQAISDVTQFGSTYKKIGGFKFYRYTSSNRQIMATVNRYNTHINFISGGWFEIFVRDFFINALEKAGLPYDFMQNIKITLPNGDQFELDLIFQVKDKFFWFEAKTGQYERYIERYRNMSKILNLPSEQTMMVLTEINENIANTLEPLFNMRVVNIPKFQEEINEIIRQFKANGE